MTIFNSILGPSGISAGFPEIYNPNATLITQKEYVYIFYFATINTDGNTSPLVLNANSYNDYNNFVSAGVLPLANQNISVSDATGYIEVNKTVNYTEVTIELINRPLPIIEDLNYVTGIVEIWSRYLDSDGNIPASRKIDILNYNTSGGLFTYSGGNPANRTYPGTLQSNGFYKSIFNISFPSFRSGGFSGSSAQLYFSGKVSPFSVPPSADISA